MEFTQNKIDKTFYDEDTFNMLYLRLTEEEKLFILSYDEDITMNKDLHTREIEDSRIQMNKFIYQRWNIIVRSLTGDYYNEYASMEDTDRNKWFQKYLNLPSHNIMEMPVSLLPI